MYKYFVHTYEFAHLFCRVASFLSGFLTIMRRAVPIVKP